MNRTIDYDAWYRMYYMEVFSYVMTILREKGQAEEITQETFFRALKSEYRGEAGEVTWLCSIAKNLCMDELRKSKRTQELTEEIPEEGNLETALADKETTLQIHLVLHTLAEPYKEVFSLRVFGELSFASIGEIFEKTENWARVTYHRAKLQIQEKLSK